MHWRILNMNGGQIAAVSTASWWIMSFSNDSNNEAQDTFLVSMHIDKPRNEESLETA